jgi:hypothetical protein
MLGKCWCLSQLLDFLCPLAISAALGYKRGLNAQMSGSSTCFVKKRTSQIVMNNLFSASPPYT